MITMNDLPAKEYLKQYWLEYPTLVHSRFDALHGVFSKYTKVNPDGTFDEGWPSLFKMRKRFKIEFQDFQKHFERKRIKQELAFVKKNLDYIFDQYLPSIELAMGFEYGDYITDYYVYNVQDSCLLFNLNANVKRDWLEAALECAEYWCSILSKWEYYHPNTRIMEIAKLRVIQNIIRGYLGQRSVEEQEQISIEILENL